MHPITRANHSAVLKYVSVQFCLSICISARHRPSNEATDMRHAQIDMKFDQEDILRSSDNKQTETECVMSFGSGEFRDDVTHDLSKK
jgi:hypothetical protein